MLSLIQKLLRTGQLLNAVCERLTELESHIAQIETKLERFEKLADENESLWQFLDDEKEIEGIFMGDIQDFEEEFTDIMVRNMKPKGDA